MTTSRPWPGGIVPSLILDAGAVIALSRGDRKLRARLAEAARDRAVVVVPPAVVTQTTRGGPRDAPINQLLKAVDVPPVDLDVAREAGRLLGAADMSDVADAQVVAEALRRLPCLILASDPEDLERLAQGRRGIQIVPV